LISAVANAVNIPVIACGGVSHPQHFVEGLQMKASAVAAANYFHFMEHSPIVAKAFLHRQDINIRLDTYANYDGFVFNQEGRITKRDDEYLEKIRFEYQPQEVI